MNDTARFEEEQETKGAVEAPTAADAEVKAGIAAAHCDDTLSSADALTEVGARVHPNSFIIFTVCCLLIKIVQSCGPLWAFLPHLLVLDILS